MHNFCVVDLGGFYLDILKDRLYTTPEASHARRSAQTAMWHIAESVVRWLAPILAFTAEEIWGHLSPAAAAPAAAGQGRPGSVFLSTWHELPQTGDDGIDWEALMALRADVARELERLRAAGTIGAPLDAQLAVWCVPQQYQRLSVLGAELRFFTITSEAQVHQVVPEEVVALSAEVARSPASVPADAVPAESVPGGGVWIRVQPYAQPKCVRCWHHRADVGASAEHPELCGRCIGNLALPGEARVHC